MQILNVILCLPQLIYMRQRAGGSTLWYCCKQPGMMFQRTWFHVLRNLISCSDEPDFGLQGTWFQVADNLISCSSEPDFGLQGTWFQVADNLISCSGEPDILFYWTPVKPDIRLYMQPDIRLLTLQLSSTRNLIKWTWYQVHIAVSALTLLNLISGFFPHDIRFLETFIRFF